MWLAELRTDIALWPRQVTRCAPLPHNFAYRFNGYSNRLSDVRWESKAYLPHIILKSGTWGKRTYMVAYLNME